VTRSEATLLDRAARIGRTLCKSAYWHEGRCNWVGRSSREMVEPGLPLTPRVTALGPDLYNGSAGVALFLAELNMRARSAGFEKTARGAIRQALEKSGDLPSITDRGFYSGPIGIAHAAARVGVLLDDSSLTAKALALAQRTVDTNRGDHLLDVIGGNAGAIAPLLQLSRMPGGRGLETSALAFAGELAGAATQDGEVWSWGNNLASGTGEGTAPLCSFAHGASGMGLALIESGVFFKHPEWIEGGLAAFRYEDRHYDADHDNWPDLRPRNSRSDAPKRTAFMVAWCHGSAGIGLARLRALRLLPERRPELEAGIQRAIRSVTAALKAMPDEVDTSPCHGRGGIAETLLYASAVLGDRQYAERVIESWTRIVRTRAAKAPWPCGVASGWNNPSLMLGDAGTGFSLLRAHEPDRTPSVLVIETERLAA
jgi:lantibiotic biosynthesis protein